MVKVLTTKSRCTTYRFNLPTLFLLGEMQLDNRLLPALPPSSKLERLAIECMQSDMSAPCKPRQKWYCENDAGRWRKHKCKSSVLNIPLPNDRAYRKCACFTPDGLVYKKLPVRKKNLFIYHSLYISILATKYYQERS